MQNYLRPTHECNHGQAIKKYREAKGYLKQSTLAEAMGLSQQTISDYERSKILSDNIIKKFADFLGIDEIFIRNLKEEEKTNVSMENPTFEAGSNPVFGTDFNNTHTITNNPLDALVAAYDKIIQAEKDKLAVIMKMREEDHKRIEILEQKISELNKN